jgi:hypothetical protein
MLSIAAKKAVIRHAIWRVFYASFVLARAAIVIKPVTLGESAGAGMTQ